MDSYYLEFLENTKIPEFQKLVPIVRSINERCQGHLWMVGVDYFEFLPTKYKIYMKTKGSACYAALRAGIKEVGIPQAEIWQEELETLECWQTEQEELVLDGIAVCVDTKGQWSFNFYDFWR